MFVVFVSKKFLLETLQKTLDPVDPWTSLNQNTVSLNQNTEIGIHTVQSTVASVDPKTYI